jgi:hypothetical protein
MDIDNKRKKEKSKICIYFYSEGVYHSVGHCTALHWEMCPKAINRKEIRRKE